MSNSGLPEGIYPGVSSISGLAQANQAIWVQVPGHSVSVRATAATPIQSTNNLLLTIDSQGQARVFGGSSSIPTLERTEEEFKKYAVPVVQTAEQSSWILFNVYETYGVTALVRNEDDFWHEDGGEEASFIFDPNWYYFGTHHKIFLKYNDEPLVLMLESFHTGHDLGDFAGLAIQGGLINFLPVDETTVIMQWRGRLEHYVLDQPAQEQFMVRTLVLNQAEVVVDVTVSTGFAPIASSTPFPLTYPEVLQPYSDFLMPYAENQNLYSFGIPVYLDAIQRYAEVHGGSPETTSPVHDFIFPYQGEFYAAGYRGYGFQNRQWLNPTVIETTEEHLSTQNQTLEVNSTVTALTEEGLALMGYSYDTEPEDNAFNFGEVRDGYSERYGVEVPAHAYSNESLMSTTGAVDPFSFRSEYFRFLGIRTCPVRDEDLQE